MSETQRQKEELRLELEKLQFAHEVLGILEQDHHKIEHCQCSVAAEFAAKKALLGTK